VKIYCRLFIYFNFYLFRVSVRLWACNFNSQLANALIIEGDYHSAFSALESGFDSASQLCYPELQVIFNFLLIVYVDAWFILLITISLICYTNLRCFLQLRYCTCI
jgi:hypothetical protein